MRRYGGCFSAAADDLAAARAKVLARAVQAVAQAQAELKELAAEAKAVSKAKAEADAGLGEAERAAVTAEKAVEGGTAAANKAAMAMSKRQLQTTADSFDAASYTTMRVLGRVYDLVHNRAQAAYKEVRFRVLCRTHCRSRPCKAG
jgi:hypothetical protein